MAAVRRARGRAAHGRRVRPRCGGRAEAGGRSAPGGLDGGRERGGRGGGVVGVAEEGGEGGRVEGPVGGWRPCGARADERHMAVASDRGEEQVRALSEANDTA